MRLSFFSSALLPLSSAFHSRIFFCEGKPNRAMQITASDTFRLAVGNPLC
jgi:hypothetical protein